MSEPNEQMRRQSNAVIGGTAQAVSQQPHPGTSGPQMATRTPDGVQAKMMDELGVIGLRFAGESVYEEFLPQLTWPYASDIYQEMSSNDPVVGAILYMCEQLIRTCTWTVEPCSKNEADIEVAKFVESCMNDMTCTWNDTICEWLSYLTYGWSFAEIIYKYRRGKNTSAKYNSKYDDGRIGWLKMPTRSQHTLYGWRFDDCGEVTGFIQQAPPNWDIVTIPMSKGLLFRTKVTHGNPEGRSLLRNAYRPWYFKKHIEEIEGIGIERDLAGLPVLTCPEGVDIWDTENPTSARLRMQAEGVVKGIRRDAQDGLVLPHGWEFKLVCTGGSRQFDTNAIINRYDQRIAMTLLADLVLIGSNSTGSYALAEVKQSTLAASLEAQLDMMAETINRGAVEPLVDMNYFPNRTGYPKLVPGEIETPSLEDLGKFFKDTGMRIDDDYELNNFIRQIASLPTISKEEFEELRERRDALRANTQAATNAHTANMNSLTGNSADGRYHINRPDGSADKDNNGGED